MSTLATPFTSLLTELFTDFNHEPISTAAVPTVSIDDVTFWENSTTSAIFTVSLSAASADTITLDYETGDGLATAGSDYSPLSDHLTFAPGETTKTITVQVADDTEFEGDEFFLVNLSNVTNATFLNTDGVATILDDESMPSSGLSVSNVTVLEGDSGVTNAIFTVSLTDSSTIPISVNYETLDSTAIAGSDYISTNGLLTFVPGETSKTVTVQVKGDAIAEADEYFSILLSNATNTTIVDSIGTATITDDDTNSPGELASVSINNVTVLEGDNGVTNAIFTVSLAESSSTPISVNYATANSTAIADSDYSAISGTLSFAPGETTKTVTVQVKGDAIVEANETFSLVLSNANHATITDSIGTGTISNDDQTDPNQGTSGNDHLIGSSGADEIDGKAGNDRITGLNGHDVLLGGDGNDIVRGGNGSDRIYGGRGNDRLYGDRGKDIIWADGGSDRAWGGQQRDSFALQKGAGKLIIQDFVNGQDKLGLTAGLTFKQLTISQLGKNTLVSVGNNPLAVLQGISAKYITAADFTRVAAS
jgi:Ca2+-binding RTX toxin-like protein